MTFATPLALLALLAIPALILLARWRRRPRAKVWPSLLLWRAIKEADAPSRRRADPLLLLECASIALLAFAAAEPALTRTVEERKITAIIDNGAHMQARLQDGRTAREATEAELPPGVEKIVAPTGDLVRMATSMDGAVILATNRPDVEGPGYVTVGRAPDGHNVGIDAVEVTGDRMWFALATEGEPIEVAVEVGGTTMRVKTGTLVETAFAESIRIVEGEGGNCGVDDAVTLRKVVVRVKTDSDSPYLEAALRAGLPVTTEFPGGTAPDLIIETKGGEPVPGVVRGTDCIAGPGLFDGLVLDDCVWRGVRAMDEWLSPRTWALLTHRGQMLAAWGGVFEYADALFLWLGLPLDRDWDEHGTLAVLIDRAKRAAAPLGPGEAWAGDAVCRPAPGLVDTRGVDRPFDEERRKKLDRLLATTQTTTRTELRWMLASLAALALVFYVRAMVRRA